MQVSPYIMNLLPSSAQIWTHSSVIQQKWFYIAEQQHSKRLRTKCGPTVVRFENTVSKGLCFYFQVCTTVSTFKMFM